MPRKTGRMLENKCSVRVQYVDEKATGAVNSGSVVSGRDSSIHTRIP